MTAPAGPAGHGGSETRRRRDTAAGHGGGDARPVAPRFTRRAARWMLQSQVVLSAVEAEGRLALARARREAGNVFFRAGEHGAGYL